MRVMSVRGNEYRQMCLNGDIHDFKKQQLEFAEIVKHWRTSSVFLTAAVPILAAVQPLEEAIVSEVQTQTFKIFHFQLANIRSSLADIFYAKLKELKRDDSTNIPHTTTAPYL